MTTSATSGFVDVVLDIADRIVPTARRAVEGLDGDDLAWRPDPMANTIGWLVWHTARLQDDHVADLMGEPQLYTAEGWAERLGLPADDTAIGYGDDVDEVAAHTPADAGVLLGYLEAVVQRTRAFLRALDGPALARVVDEGWDPPVTLGVRLASVLVDDLQHVGQAGYVRGLLDRRGA